MTRISTAPGELGLEASTAIRDIARRIANGRTSTMLLSDDLTSSWAALTQGGWDGIGIRDGADGDGDDGSGAHDRTPLTARRRGRHATGA